jgi:hypothetical protein
VEDPQNLDLVITDLVRDDEGTSRHDEFTRAAATSWPADIGEIAESPDNLNDPLDLARRRHGSILGDPRPSEGKVTLGRLGPDDAHTISRAWA